MRSSKERQTNSWPIFEFLPSSTVHISSRKHAAFINLSFLVPFLDRIRHCCCTWYSSFLVLRSLPCQSGDLIVFPVTASHGDGGCTWWNGGRGRPTTLWSGGSWEWGRCVYCAGINAFGEVHKLRYAPGERESNDMSRYTGEGVGRNITLFA